MNAVARLLATAIALAIPTLALLQWSDATNQPTRLEKLELSATIDDWVMTHESHLGDNILAMIEPDSYLMRLYEAPGRSPIWLYVGAYGARAGYGKRPHNPETCYPAQGWEITASSLVDVLMGDNASLNARALEAEKEGRQEAILYWFQPATRWPSHPVPEQFFRVVDAMTGSPQFAFVRLSAMSDGGQTAERDLADFAKKLAPRVRRALAINPTEIEPTSTPDSAG